MMKTLIILVIWGQLGGTSGSAQGWMVVGEFADHPLCTRAGFELQTNNKGDVAPFRCLDTGKVATWR